ncbi:MAG: hypothetical protein RBS57_21325, partial [Desulforhabdus sp.]|nr:hypothetical protein [Desulforhabdus sp.]
MSQEDFTPIKWSPLLFIRNFLHKFCVLISAAVPRDAVTRNDQLSRARLFWASASEGWLLPFILLLIHAWLRRALPTPLQSKLCHPQCRSRWLREIVWQAFGRSRALSCECLLEYQRYYVGKEAIPEVITNSGFSLIIEGFTVVQVISDFFQYDDIFNSHDLRLALSFSRDMNSALPASIFLSSLPGCPDAIQGILFLDSL